MEKKDKFNLLTIFRSNNTVFTFKDFLLTSEGENPLLLKRRINYYVKKGLLFHIRRGIYAKDKNYNTLELAIKILTPSYISFETVLSSAGMIFQYYPQIFTASYQTKEITADGRNYVFHRLKDEILTNTTGIEQKENYSIATPERAFLDILYLNKDFYFDNLSPLNWDKVREILPVYGGNKRMERLVNQYIHDVRPDKT